MKCPNDTTDMLEGWFVSGRWVGVPMKNLSWWIRPMSSVLIKSIPVTAWRCPECGKVELYSEVRN